MDVHYLHQGGSLLLSRSTTDARALSRAAGMGIEVFASPVVSMAGNAMTDLQNLPISLVQVCEQESHPANRNWYIAVLRILGPVMTVESDVHSFARLSSLSSRLTPDSVDLIYTKNAPLCSCSATDLRLYVKYRTGGAIKKWEASVLLSTYSYLISRISGGATPFSKRGLWICAKMFRGAYSWRHSRYIGGLKRV
jgi:hypothetical protein